MVKTLITKQKCIEKLNQDENKLQNFMKNPISVISSIIKNLILPFPIPPRFCERCFEFSYIYLFILNTSIINPKKLMNSLKEISQYNLPLPAVHWAILTASKFISPNDDSILYVTI